MCLLRLSAAVLVVLVATASARAESATSGCIPLTIRVEPAALIESCTKALAEPDLTSAQRAVLMLYRGRGYKEIGRLAAASDDFDTGLALAPDNIDLHVFRGWVEYDRRDFSALDPLTAELAARFPNEPKVLDLIGAAAVQHGDLAAGRHAYDKVLAIDPGNVLALDHRAHLFWRVHDYGSALKDLEALAASKNRDVDDKYGDFYGRKISYRTLARLDRVRILENMGHTDKIEEALADFARIEPGAVSYGWWAMFHQRRSLFDRAQAEIKQALTYDPDFWFLHHLLGTNLLYLKQYELAVRSYDRAIELNPKSGSSHWQRALALRELQRTDEAMEEAARAVEIEPAFISNIGPTLLRLGYLQAEANAADLAPMVHDAVRACMLDERCW